MQPTARQLTADDLGIVVIGRNEGARLIRCLGSAMRCSDTIVYVDSGSTDGSLQAARDLGAHVVALDPAEPFTAARARNAGFGALKKLEPAVGIVQFVDGDCEIAAGWIADAIAALNRMPDVAVVCGRRRERHPDASVYNRLCDEEWNTQVGEALACGGDSMIRTSAFEEGGGFRAGLIAGEEPELCVRLRGRGWKIVRIGAEMTLHDAAMTRFPQWWRRNVRAGHAFAEVSRLHRRSAQGIWRRETLRALLWGGALPAAAGMSAFIAPLSLLVLAFYPIQVARIAWRKGPAGRDSWTYALFVVLAKFPEFVGVLTYYWRDGRGRSAAPIEYKPTAPPQP